MGTVYEALHTVLEKPVALKVLHPELARKQDLVDRFLQEAKAASRIRHENVIDISDFGVVDGHVYFAMELLQGHDLHEEISSARKAGKLLPWTRSKNIFLQICNALSAAHERGIVHRDLKPENIYLIEMRGDPDFVKLLDFGIAKLTDVSESEEGRKLTKTGMLFGTPEYMAPEQARGEKADHRVDVYAMGCILFLLVSNRLPFQGDNFMAVLSQQLTDDPPEIAPETFDMVGAPRELTEVIDRALEKDREYRWQSIDELAAAVYEVCGDAPPKPRRTRAPSVPAPGETTRMRTPTDQPRSRTPSNSGRMKTPTGPRSKEPTAPPRTSTPEVSWIGSSQGPAPRSKPPTAPPKTPEVSWIGSSASGEGPAAMITLGPTPDPESKGHHAAAIIAGIFVLGTIAAVAYFLGWFGGNKKSATEAPVATAPVAPAAVPEQVTPPPTPVEPPSTEPLPDVSEIVIDSSPRSASIIALPDNVTVGKTPYTLTVTGSAMPRHYKLVLAGYDEMAVDVTPNKPKLTIKPTLVRTGAARPPTPTAPTPKTDTKTQPAADSAVTKPDTSTAVTKPDTTTPTPPPPTPEPEKPAPDEPDDPPSE